MASNGGGGTGTLDGGNNAQSPVIIVHSDSDLVFQFDENGEVYYVSDNVEQITGYSKPEFLEGKVHPLDIVHPEDKPKLRNEFDSLFMTHKAVEGSTHRIVKRTGEIGYLMKSWYILTDSTGRFTGVIGLNKDITNEKSLERRLQLFHSAFEHSTDAILITGVDGKIIDVNDAFTDIYGYTREEAIGGSTAILQSRHSTPDFYRQLWDSLASSNQWHGEIINRRKDGVEIPIWLSITPIYLDGTKIGYMGIEADISERKNLEQQIIQTEKLATIGQLSAGIAHEIGTPLNIISGNAEFMMLDMKPTDTGYAELTTIIDQTRRVSQLIRQLLDFARPKILSLQAVNINDLLRDVLSFVRLQFKKGNIVIKTELDENASDVYGDPSLLYQVFLNIIVNAFQAMTKDGELNVSTGSDGEDSGRKKVRIVISDSGEGIPKKHLEKIFTPFFTTKEPGKGTGLGLAVTKRIVQEHNGAIDIQSEVGKGTTVTIHFIAFEPKEKAE